MRILMFLTVFAFFPQFCKDFWSFRYLLNFKQPKGASLKKNKFANRVEFAANLNYGLSTAPHYLIPKTFIRSVIIDIATPPISSFIQPTKYCLFRLVSWWRARKAADSTLKTQSKDRYTHVFTLRLKTRVHSGVSARPRCALESTATWTSMSARAIR